MHEVRIAVLLTLHDCLLCAYYTTDQQQGLTRYTTFQQKESQTTLSGLQTIFHNQTHVRGDTGKN